VSVQWTPGANATGKPAPAPGAGKAAPIGSVRQAGTLATSSALVLRGAYLATRDYSQFLRYSDGAGFGAVLRGQGMMNMAEYGGGIASNVMSSVFLVETAVSATTNGIRLARKQVTPGRAVGNVAADTALGAGKALVAATVASGVATQLAQGAVRSPVAAGLIGATAAIGALVVANVAIDRTGLQARLSNRVTSDIERAERFLSSLVPGREP